MAGTRLQAAAEKGCLMGVPEGRAGPDDAGRAHGQRHKSVTSSRSPPRPQPFEELPPMPRTEHSPQLCLLGLFEFRFAGTWRRTSVA
jgi:hypothetical protein